MVLLYWHSFHAAIYMDLIGSVLLCFKIHFYCSIFFIVDSDPWIWPNVVPCTSKNHLIIFFSRWLTTAEMFGHFPACLCCVTCQPRAEGLACASTYILTMLNCIVSAHSLTNLKRRVSLLHTSLNRQFDVHYCLEPLQFSHGYQRKEQLMAIFFLSHSGCAVSES